MIQPLYKLFYAQHIDISSHYGYDWSHRNLYKHDATYSNPSQWMLAINSAGCLNLIGINKPSIFLNAVRSEQHPTRHSSCTHAHVHYPSLYTSTRPQLMQQLHLVSLPLPHATVSSYTSALAAASTTRGPPATRVLLRLQLKSAGVKTHCRTSKSPTSEWRRATLTYKRW